MRLRLGSWVGWVRAQKAQREAGSCLNDLAGRRGGTCSECLQQVSAQQGASLSLEGHTQLLVMWPWMWPDHWNGRPTGGGYSECPVLITDHFTEDGEAAHGG